MADWMVRDHEIIADGVVIGHAHLTGVGPQGERERLENARLMGAAPKLLAALEWAMRQVGSEPRLIPGQNDKYCDAYAAAHAAIADATNGRK